MCDIYMMTGYSVFVVVVINFVAASSQAFTWIFLLFCGDDNICI